MGCCYPKGSEDRISNIQYWILNIRRLTTDRPRYHARFPSSALPIPTSAPAGPLLDSLGDSSLAYLICLEEEPWAASTPIPCMERLRC